MPQLPGTNFCGGYDPDLVKGPCFWCEFNPINALVGNKYEVARDYSGEGVFPIAFERVYNSWGAAPGAVMGFYPEYLEPNPETPSFHTYTPFSPVANGQGIVPTPAFVGSSTNSPIDSSWRHNYDRTLATVTISTASYAMLLRADSKKRTFTLTNGVWVADPGQQLTSLTQQANGNWIYVNEKDETETYDPNGKLLSIANRAGLTQTLQYNSFNALASVTDAFGRQLMLTYDNMSRLSKVTDPKGGNYAYTYDGNGNLSTVTYPDGHSLQYVYENTSYPTALTGIVDENGVRFATWAYDNYGNAISSQHAGGVEQGTLTFPSATGSTATDTAGATRSYTNRIINGMPMATAVSETWNGGTRTKSLSYDADNNIASKTDYNGNVTNYSYDQTRDLETSRTEAFGTAQARTIITQWHPSIRLPLTVTEPGRVTSYTYDPAGNQLSKTITAGGNSRTWTYTYNAAGQILSATGPRNDVVDHTSYAYDSFGNLQTITNAAGQVTTLANYDANGRVGLITDPNGATTALSYSPRGWLTSKVVTAGGVVQSTGYTYDYVGQLTKVTLPDGSYLNYTYDAAHRLTNIADSLGNSIAYTLDAMDNRVTETVKDPSSVLTRQVSRVFDTINRLQQVTGAAQ